MVSLWSVTKAYEGQANGYWQSSPSKKRWEVLFAPRELAIPGIADTSIEMILNFGSIALEPIHQLLCWQGINHGPEIIDGHHLILSPQYGNLGWLANLQTGLEVPSTNSPYLVKCFSSSVSDTIRNLAGLVGYPVPYGKSAGKHMVARFINRIFT